MSDLWAQATLGAHDALYLGRAIALSRKTRCGCAAFATCMRARATW